MCVRWMSAGIDDTVDRVLKHGGSVVVPKMAVPGVGWLVYFKDTEGNILGAMQADPGPGNSPRSRARERSPSDFGRVSAVY